MKSVTHILCVSKFFINQFIAIIPTSYSVIKHHNDPNFQSDGSVDSVLKPLPIIRIFYENELCAPYQLLQYVVSSTEEIKNRTLPFVWVSFLDS